MIISAFKSVFSKRNTLSVSFCASGLALILALYAQHVDGHEPCSLCMLSRLLMIGLLLSSLVGLMCKNSLAVQTLSQSVAAGFSFAGVYWSIFQMDPVSRMSCGLSKTARFLESSGLDSLAPWFFEIRAMCAGDLSTWFGLTFPTWGLLIYLVCGSAIVISLMAEMAGRRDLN